MDSLILKHRHSKPKNKVRFHSTTNKIISDLKNTECGKYSLCANHPRETDKHPTTRRTMEATITMLIAIDNVT